MDEVRVFAEWNGRRRLGSGLRLCYKSRLGDRMVIADCRRWPSGSLQDLGCRGTHGLVDPLEHAAESISETNKISLE